MEEKIRLEMSDWLYNVGLVGLINILEHSNDVLRLDKNYAEINATCLENFEEKYFRFLFDKYGMFTVYSEIIGYREILENYLNSLEGIDEKKLDSLNKIIDYVKSKINRNSYKAAYPYIMHEIDLLKEEKKLKKLKLNKGQEISVIRPEIKFQLELLISIIEYMSTKETKRYLMAKDFIYSFTNAFLSGVAVWGKTEASKDPYKVYKNYFIDSVNNYMKNNKDKYKFKCTVCDRPVKGIKVKNESYDLTWVNGTGVDGSRKSSHYWNYNNDTAICPICNLVYSCIPAGFTFINGKGFFINNNNNLIELHKVNKFQIDKGTKIEDLETLSYYNVLDSMEQNNIFSMDSEIQNIQVVKYDNDNLLRPYTFNILSKRMLYVIYKNKDTIKKLLNLKVKVGKDYWINVYQEVIKRLYNNESQFDLIGDLFKYNVSSYYLYLILNLNTDFIGGRMELSQKDEFKRKVDLSRYFGLQLRESYLIKGNEKKIEGISYRLLNAIKTKNSSRFADILINAHMYVEKEVPSIFIDTLKEKELLQSFGYGFLLGLQGTSKKNNNESKEDK
ncbi:MAG: type I-B CRISPR-associated protein Cas8b1/Cst1 [Tissierellales bacterium]